MERPRRRSTQRGRLRRRDVRSGREWVPAAGRDFASTKRFSLGPKASSPKFKNPLPRQASTTAADRSACASQNGDPCGPNGHGESSRAFRSQASLRRYPATACRESSSTVNEPPRNQANIVVVMRSKLVVTVVTTSASFSLNTISHLTPRPQWIASTVLFSALPPQRPLGPLNATKPALVTASSNERSCGGCIVGSPGVQRWHPVESSIVGILCVFKDFFSTLELAIFRIRNVKRNAIRNHNT